MKLDFIQIGANIGNTDTDPLWPVVSEKKWKGIFVEPIKESFRQLKENYSSIDGCFFENIAILDYNGEVTIHTTESDAWHRQQASVNPHHWGGRNSVSFVVPCTTLTQLVEKYNMFDTPFKILQIDAEGADYRILLNTDFSNIHPEFIRYEHCHMSSTEKQSVQTHLNNFGYTEVPDEFDYSVETGSLDTLMKKEMV